MYQTKWNENEEETDRKKKQETGRNKTLLSTR